MVRRGLLAVSTYEIVLWTVVVCLFVAGLVVIPLRNKADEPDEIHEADPEAVRKLEIECQTGPGWDDYLNHHRARKLG